MKAAITLLVLLFSMCGIRSTQTEVQAESQSTGAAAAAAAEVSTKVDIYAELKELRDMVVEQRVLLTITKTEPQNTKADMMKEVENLKKENAAQEADLAEVKTRLAASEAEVMNLREETAELSADLRSVAERLAATETDLEHVKKETSAQDADLTTMKNEVMNLTKENEATNIEVEKLKMDSAAHEAELTVVKTRLAATETEVENLEMNGTPKVAFSAGLTDSGYIQAGNTDMNLVFSRDITNVGKAYSSTTGCFTAPVRGVYYFRVTVMDLMHSHRMEVHMIKNGERLINLSEYETHGQANYVSSGLTLQLEVGDVVNMRLKAGHRLYDNANNYNVFTGFLLFTL